MVPLQSRAIVLTLVPKELPVAIDAFEQADKITSSTHVKQADEVPEAKLLRGITLARAGHDAPLWYQHQSQTVTPVKSPGMVVGIDSGSVFDRLTVDFAVPLEHNDCLVLYTDGLTETLNSEGEEFGVDRMMQSVRASANDGAQAMVKRIIGDVREFTGSVPQNDDMTLIAIRRT